MTDQTIAEQLGLDEDDPWDTRSDERKQRDAMRKALLDQLHAERESQPNPTFIEPDDDESLAFTAKGRMFYRLMIAGHKLSAVIKLEPSILSVTVAGRNNAQGCWVVFNSLSVARRLVRALQGHGIVVPIVSVDPDGNLFKSNLSDEDYLTLLDGLKSD